MSAAHILEGARAAGEAAGGPAWLVERRRAAAERAAALGLPTTKNEDWHYTSVAPLAEPAWEVRRHAKSPVALVDLAPYTFGQSGWPTMVFVNGRFAPALSSLADLPAGVRIMDLAAALRDEPELLERHLGTVATLDHAFTAVNGSVLEEGALVHVAKEMVVDVPLHLLFVSDAGAEGAMAHPRVLVVAERHSKATIVESWIGLGDARYFNNAVTEVHLADGATVHHLKVQREGRRAFHVGTVEAHQARDSHFVSFSFATGGALARTNVYTVLDGEGSGATLNGLYMVDGEQHVDHQTRIEHAQPNCFSREVYKGLLDGASRAVFNGKVYVQPIAQQTDGKQENNNLLLSERAQVYTKPQLEIFADDVKCTHGATVGRIDETALFYMKSRGIAAPVARRLLVYAFAADVLETIEQPEVREALEAMTLERFAGEEAGAGV